MLPSLLPTRMPNTRPEVHRISGEPINEAVRWIHVIDKAARVNFRQTSCPVNALAWYVGSIPLFDQRAYAENSLIATARALLVIRDAVTSRLYTLPSTICIDTSKVLPDRTLLHEKEISVLIRNPDTVIPLWRQTSS